MRNSLRRPWRQSPHLTTILRSARSVLSLHGLPVSLRDQFHIKGAKTTMEDIEWMDTFEGIIGHASACNFGSKIERELRGVGAGLFVKTSVPATVMASETACNVRNLLCYFILLLCISILIPNFLKSTHFQGIPGNFRHARGQIYPLGGQLSNPFICR